MTQWESASAFRETQPSCNKTVHFDVLTLYKQVTTKVETSKGKQQQHKRQYIVIRLSACYVLNQQQGAQMHKSKHMTGCDS